MGDKSHEAIFRVLETPFGGSRVGREKETIVRCKDCKHYLNSSEKCALIDTRLHFYETDKMWTEESYCSWGERKEDE